MITIAEHLRRQGEKKGIRKGIEKGFLTTAKNLLKKGQPIQLISEVTGLSHAELKKLQRQA